MQRHYTEPVTQILRRDCEGLLLLALDEDAPQGDATSDSIFPQSEQGFARTVAREGGVLSGTSAAEILVEIFNERNTGSVKFIPLLKDGDSFRKGDALFSMEGSLRSLLRLERIVLNLIQYLSGISTTVRNAVDRAPKNAVILDTRKTLPGYRRLAKYAVYCGGGSNHRISLSDMAMIKDNHIEASGSIEAAAANIRRERPGLKIEIEVDSAEQIKEALSAEPDIILLDNLSGDALKKAVETIRNASPSVFIEISGNRRPDNLDDLKDLGEIGVSMGYLTHTTRFLDLSMEVSKKDKFPPGSGQPADIEGKK